MPNGTLMFGKLTTVRIVRFSCDKKHLPPPTHKPSPLTHKPYPINPFLTLLTVYR